MDYDLIWDRSPAYELEVIPKTKEEEKINQLKLMPANAPTPMISQSFLIRPLTWSALLPYLMLLRKSISPHMPFLLHFSRIGESTWQVQHT